MVYALNHQDGMDFEGYERSDEISISYKNAGQDFSSAVTSDGVIVNGENLQAEVSVQNPEVSSLDIYVNGIYYDTCQLTDSKAGLTINKDAFTEELESKNVISFIGRNQSGETVCRNFATIVVNKPKGDMDGDGEVKLNDAKAILRAVLRIETLTEEQQALADIDENGSIDLEDVQIALKLALLVPIEK